MCHGQRLHELRATVLQNAAGCGHIDAHRPGRKLAAAIWDQERFAERSYYMGLNN